MFKVLRILTDNFPVFTVLWALLYQIKGFAYLFEVAVSTMDLAFVDIETESFIAEGTILFK